MSPNMGPTQLQASPYRRSSHTKTPKRFKDQQGCGSPMKQQNRTNGFSPNPSKQLQRSSPKSAFHPVKSNFYTNGMPLMNVNKRQSPLQVRYSPQPGFQQTEESKLRESPSYAGAKFSEAPPPDCLPSPPVGWIQGFNVLPHSPSSFKQMENNLKTMLKVAS